MSIAIMLSLLFVLPNVLGLLPMAALQAEAATVILSWSIPNSNVAVEVEEAKTFYVGDYVTYNFGGSLSKMKASYKSSNTKVATVDKNGCMKTLKPGTTTITFFTKGQN